jgi:hypothetical protein
MGEFASKGVAGAGLGTGIAGLSLGVLNSAGLLGSTAKNYISEGTSRNCTSAIDMSFLNALAEKDAIIARYESKSYTDEAGLTLYKYIDTKFNELYECINQFKQDQVAINTTVTAGMSTMSNQLANLQAVVNGITKTAIPSSVVCSFTPASSCGCSTSAT